MNLGVAHESSYRSSGMLLPTRTMLCVRQAGEHRLFSCHLVRRRGFHDHNRDKLHSPLATHAPQFQLDYILRFLMNLSSTQFALIIAAAFYLVDVLLKASSFLSCWQYLSKSNSISRLILDSF